MSNHHILILPSSSLGHSAYVGEVSHIVACLKITPHFPEPWAAGLGLSKLIGLFDLYENAYQAALNRDLIKIDERNTARENLNTELKKVALYLELVADGDIAKLKSTGFALRQEPTPHRTSGEPLPAPSDLRVTHGVLSGTLDVHIAKLADATFYTVQISTAVDPTDESSWRQATLSTTSQHILLEGLTPLQPLWVRVCGNASDGPGLWTAPVRIVVL